MFFKKMIGEKVYLSPAPTEDENFIRNSCKWLNDLRIAKNLNHIPNLDEKAERDFLTAIQSGSDQIFAIVETGSDLHLGSCGLHGIDSRNRSATIGIFIGEESSRNKGYGTEALSLLADYGFNVLNLHSLHLEVYEYNSRAIRCYEKVGFRLAGGLRKAQFWGGKYYDVIFMDILSEEFKSPFIQGLIEG